MKKSNAEVDELGIILNMRKLRQELKELVAPSHAVN